MNLLFAAVDESDVGQRRRSQDARSSVDSLGIAVQVNAETGKSMSYSITSSAPTRMDAGRVR